LGPEGEEIAQVTATENAHFVKVWVDGGLLMKGRHTRETRGIYWSMRCEDGDKAPAIIRRQETKYRTNNDAEWLALLEGLNYVAVQCKDKPIVIYSDSMLIVKQFNGLNRATIQRHAMWKHEALQLAAECRFISVQWVKRDVNLEKLGH
jgi:ribonuclease HI